jgi:hypothetical protein
MRTGKIMPIDFERPDVVLFYKGHPKNSWEVNGALYFVTKFDYISPRAMYIILTCKRDPTFLYHGNVMSSRVVARVMKSQILRGTKDKDDFLPYQDVCFSFCSDLRRPKNSMGIVKDSDSEISSGVPENSQ